MYAVAPQRQLNVLKGGLDVLPDYSLIVSEREGMRGGPEETAYGLFADFVRAVGPK